RSRLFPRKIFQNIFPWLIMVHAIVKSSKCFLELIQIGKPITALREKKGTDEAGSMTLLTCFHSGSSQYPLSHASIGTLHAFVLTEEDHCARPLQKPPISSVIVILLRGSEIHDA